MRRDGARRWLGAVGFAVTLHAAALVLVPAPVGLVEVSVAMVSER